MDHPIQLPEEFFDDDHFPECAGLSDPDKYCDCDTIEMRVRQNYADTRNKMIAEFRSF